MERSKQTSKSHIIPDHDTSSQFNNNIIDDIIDPPIKKRGRKPKGGKIIENSLSAKNSNLVLPNVIIHLKCSMKDLNKQLNDIESYNKGEHNYEVIETSYASSNININTNTKYDNKDAVDNVEGKELNKKLKELEVKLHLNDTSDNHSACFWCTYEFDNLPIYIPKHFIRNSYEVYGCFCSPECSCAYLMNEHIDFATKFERYHLLNNIYGKIYNYKQNIKPAPSPHYTLKKFNGNLSIQEYRSLFKFERLFIIVDKPLTKILPELHEDNDDFLLNKKSIPCSNYSLKKKVSKRVNKTDIINDKFGMI